MWRALPPAPAHASKILWFELTSKNSATSCDDASCNSKKPNLNSMVLKIFTLFMTFKAFGRFGISSQ